MRTFLILLMGLFSVTASSQDTRLLEIQSFLKRIPVEIVNKDIRKKSQLRVVRFRKGFSLIEQSNVLKIGLTLEPRDLDLVGIVSFTAKKSDLDSMKRDENLDSNIAFLKKKIQKIHRRLFSLYVDRDPGMLADAANIKSFLETNQCEYQKNFYMLLKLCFIKESSALDTDTLQCDWSVIETYALSLNFIMNLKTSLTWVERAEANQDDEVENSVYADIDEESSAYDGEE